MDIMHTTKLQDGDASSSDPSISSWTATKWLGSDFCLPQVPEGGFVRTQRTPPPYGPDVHVAIRISRLFLCIMPCVLSCTARSSSNVPSPTAEQREHHVLSFMTTSLPRDLSALLMMCSLAS